jgi:hypothetical protein
VRACVLLLWPLQRITSPKAKSVSWAELPSLHLKLSVCPGPGGCGPRLTAQVPSAATVAFQFELLALPVRETATVAAGLAPTPHTVAFARSSTMPLEQAPPQSSPPPTEAEGGGGGGRGGRGPQQRLGWSAQGVLPAGHGAGGGAPLPQAQQFRLG